MKKTYRSRIKTTKNGKIIRRKMGSSHFRSKKSASSKQERRKGQGLDYSPKALEKRIKNT